MERLEFLGDAVLGAVIAEFLHQSFPDAKEGYLSRKRAALVRKEGLLIIARQWRLAQAVKVGAGERGIRGIKSDSIIANAVEALIGAVFVDGGWEAARSLILSAWKPLLEQVEQLDSRDAKSALQEWTQEKRLGLPIYQVKDAGVDARVRFSAQCLVQGDIVGEGSGSRKKQAETQAASQALKVLKKGQ